MGQSTSIRNTSPEPSLAEAMRSRPPPKSTLGLGNLSKPPLAFMQYVKNAKGGFDKLPKPNVDFGGGLERIASASEGSGDVFRIDVLWPIVHKIEELSGFRYDQNPTAMRVISDHLRAATWLATDGVVPSNSAQGYVMRRFIRRAIRQALALGLREDFLELVVPVITEIFWEAYPEMAAREETII